jgi:hypothetical protein
MTAHGDMETGINIVGLALAICLALVHIFASQTPWLAKIPERWWVSVAGGASIAYIFLDILPQLSHAQEAIQHSDIGLIAYLEKHVYLLALVGLAIFYGLEKLALRSRDRRQAAYGEDCTHPGVFWIPIIAFAIYNMILGYLLRESETHGLVACLLLFFALAIALWPTCTLSCAMTPLTFTCSVWSLNTRARALATPF